MTDALDPRTHRTLQAYREALTRLLKVKPLEQITVSELSLKAGYHRSTFYRYYNHVGELFDEIQDEMLSEFEAIMDRYPVQPDSRAVMLGRDEETTVPILTEAFSMIKRNSTFASVLLANPAEGQVLHRILAIGRHHALDLTRPNMSGTEAEYYDRYYTFMTGGFLTTIQRWLKEDMKMSPHKLAELCYEFISLGAVYRRK